MKDTFPVGAILENLNADGSGVVILFDSKNEEMVGKVKKLSPKYKRAFKTFSKEISETSEGVKSKVKAFLILT